MKKINSLRLSIIVNILALVFFVSPFYPNGCNKEPQEASAPTSDEREMSPDSVTPSRLENSHISMSHVATDSIIMSDSCNQISGQDSINYAQDENKFVDALCRIFFGDTKSITGFSCVVFGMQTYITEYGIITAFLFLLICLLLKNNYEKRKFLIIVILELISIPLLYFTDFDIFFIKAVPGEKLWGFWICISLIVIQFLIDLIHLLKMEIKK